MLNASIKDIPIPPRMARRPVDRRGFPVPWFVAKIDGEWDFRVIAPGAMVRAYRQRLCWLCGEPLGRYLTFVIGPMCAINRVNSEPPSHHDCAIYALKACPFIARPNMRRNEKDLPEEYLNAAGIHIPHNPGVMLLWVTHSYKPFDAGNGVLFELGPPCEAVFYREGRPATRAEILDAINKGLPHLREAAKADGGEKQLDAEIERAMKLLPAA
jgi:hypothetical protein